MMKYLFTIAILTICLTTSAQTADDSGISAGFFDSSQDKDINFSEFKLPPLAVLFENAKSNPNILQLAKMEEIAQEVRVYIDRHVKAPSLKDAYTAYLDYAIQRKL